MRSGPWVVLLVVAWCTAALAGPPRPKPPGPPPEQAELNKLQTDLAQLQVKQQYVAAIKLARKLVDLQIKISGKDDRQVGFRKQQLAGLLQTAGNYSEAIKIYKELLANDEREHGPESREVLYALQSLAGAYMGANRWEEVDPLHARMLAISKKLDGENSKNYAMQLVQYGGVLYAHNEYTAATRAYEQALKIDEAIDPNDTMLQSEVQMLGSLYWATNQRPKAMAMFDRAISIAEHAKTATPYTVGATIWAVAATYHWGGREDLAKPMMKRALDMYDKEAVRLEKDKPDDYQLPLVLGMGGFAAQQMNDLPGAEQRFKHAIAVDEKNPARAGFSSWSASLAEVLRTEGRPKEALALLEKAQAAIAKVSPMSANAYSMSIAIVLRQMGDYPRAEKLLNEYLAWAEKQYGRKHAVYSSVETQLAMVYMSAGDAAHTETLFADALESEEKQLQLVLKTGTDADHAAYFAQHNYMLDLVVNFNAQLAPRSAVATRIALTTLLRRKGRALDAAAASVATIRAKLSPEDKQLLDDLASARAQLAKLTVAGPTATGDPAEYAKEVAALEDQVARLELAVGKKSAAYRATTLAIDLPAIQKLVPKAAKLVELVNYRAGDLKTTIWTPGAAEKRRYGAYVLGSTGDPVFVDLAEADAIDDAVAKFRKAVSNPDDDRAAELGRALYDLTVAKLEPALGKATDILIAPDGTLNVVPFSALVDSKGKFLIEKYEFTYLTSGRDLLRLAVRTKAAGGGVIFANPTFDNGGPPPAKAGDGAQSRGRRSADLASLTWPPLPGTGKEAEAVAKTMHGLKEFLGADATESAVKAVHGPRILHLATHGFFLPDAAPPPADDDKGGAPPAMAAGVAAAPPVAEASENPLLRSGLALAGANKLQSGDEDGILTALEASGLDLEGTKLVVLSACETGVGKVTNGDGVYGLRRALVVAGAESLVMSLWQVDDEATKDMMVGYYQRLAKGENRSSALRDIQLELGHSEKFKHPYYWASFLPAGDNTPLKD